MSDFDNIPSAVEDAESAAASAMDDFVERLADRVGARAGAAAVFGEPVSANGVTVVPVARSRWGFGGGGGSGEGDDGEGAGSGAGGGGGATATPVGYIELADGRAVFVPISDPARVWPVVLAAGLSTWLIFRGLRALFR